jgi:hypothetical protein
MAATTMGTTETPLRLAPHLPKVAEDLKRYVNAWGNRSELFVWMGWSRKDMVYLVFVPLPAL